MSLSSRTAHSNLKLWSNQRHLYHLNFRQEKEVWDRRNHYNFTIFIGRCRAKKNLWELVGKMKIRQWNNVHLLRISSDRRYKKTNPNIQQKKWRKLFIVWEKEENSMNQRKNFWRGDKLLLQRKKIKSTLKVCKNLLKRLKTAQFSYWMWIWVIKWKDWPYIMEMRIVWNRLQRISHQSMSWMNKANLN